MEDIKAILPSDVSIVGDFIFSRKHIAAGAVPDINTVAEGTKLLLAVEPARGNEEDPFAPGVRIGTELMEMGEAVGALNDAGYHPILYVNASNLTNAGLLSGEDEAYRFNRRVAAMGVNIADLPHDIATNELATLRLMRKHWRTMDETPVGFLFLQTSAGSIMTAVPLPACRQFPEFHRNPNSQLFQVDALLLNRPKRTMANSQSTRVPDIELMASAFKKAREIFNIDIHAASLDIREFGVEVPYLLRNKAAPDTLTS